MGGLACDKSAPPRSISPLPARCAPFLNVERAATMSGTPAQRQLAAEAALRALKLDPAVARDPVDGKVIVSAASVMEKVAARQRSLFLLVGSKSLKAHENQEE
jgi:hypothetical protein